MWAMSKIVALMRTIWEIGVENMIAVFKTALNGCRYVSCRSFCDSGIMYQPCHKMLAFSNFLGTVSLMVNSRCANPNPSFPKFNRGD